MANPPDETTESLRRFATALREQASREEDRALARSLQDGAGQVDDIDKKYRDLQSGIEETRNRIRQATGSYWDNIPARHVVVGIASFLALMALLTYLTA